MGEVIRVAFLHPLGTMAFGPLALGVRWTPGVAHCFTSRVLLRLRPLLQLSPALQLPLLTYHCLHTYYY